MQLKFAALPPDKINSTKPLAEAKIERNLETISPYHENTTSEETEWMIVLISSCCVCVCNCYRLKLLRNTCMHVQQHIQYTHNNNMLSLGGHVQRESVCSFCSSVSKTRTPLSRLLR